MKSLVIFLFGSVLIAQNAIGQAIRPQESNQRKVKKSSKQNRFLISGSYTSYLNTNKDIQHYSGVKHFMSAKNTAGYQFGFSYEITSNKLTITPTVGYGVQNHDIVVNLDLKNFVPGVNFNPDHYTIDYKRKSPFMFAQIAAGYNYELFNNKKTILQGKVGIGAIHYLTYDQENLIHFVSYSLDSDPGNFYNKALAQTDFQAGGYQKAKVWSSYYNLYLGILHPINSKILKDYRIGISLSHAFITNHGNNAPNQSSILYFDYAGNVDGNETYRNKFRSISIVGSLGF